MRRLLQTTLLSIGLLLILMTALLHFRREGEGVPSLIAIEGIESQRLVQLLPLSHHRTPLTPSMRGMAFIASTPNGLLFTASSGQGDTALYRVPKIGAKPELLADQLLLRMVVSENGEWVVVADSGGLGGNYGFRAIRTDGSERYPLTLDLQEDLEIYQEAIPVISPDGEWVAFSVYAPSGDFDVYQVRIDGTGLENLTHEVTGVAQIAGWSEAMQGFIISQDGMLWYRTTDRTERLIPDVEGLQIRVAQVEKAGLELIYQESGNGNTSIYAINRTGEVIWEHQEIMLSSFAHNGAWGLGNQDDTWFGIHGSDGNVIPLQLGNQRLSLFYVSVGDWSPDGKSCLIEGIGASGEELWRLDATSGRLLRLWTTKDDIIYSEWSPDGKYALLKMASLQGGYLVLIDTDSGKTHWGWDIHVFADWGPLYQKSWSAGVMGIIGVACVGVGSFPYPHKKFKRTPSQTLPQA